MKQSCGAFVVPDQEVMDTDIEQGADAMAQNSEVGVVAGQSVGDFPDRGVVGTAHQGEAGGVDGGPRCAVGAVTDGVLGPVHPLLHHLRGPVRVDREGDHGAGGEFRAGGKFFDGLFYFAFADGVAGLVAQEESEGEADLAARGGGELRVIQDVAQGGGGGGVVDVVDGDPGECEGAAGAQVGFEAGVGENVVEEGDGGAFVAEGDGLVGGGFGLAQPGGGVAQGAGVVGDLDQGRCGRPGGGGRGCAGRRPAGRVRGGRRSGRGRFRVGRRPARLR
ncbi:hypothetical protein ACFY8P_32590 [Streptomyces sp. NPDC012693]|uniref:hypothetical protein n=1 Tax=Streptomyces sp. NPDC012693 TaxID=3364844 RepID=UPI0036BDBF0D